MRRFDYDPSKYEQEHGVLLVTAPSEEYEGEALCTCGWSTKSKISIGAVFRALEAHVAEKKRLQ